MTDNNSGRTPAKDSGKEANYKRRGARYRARRRAVDLLFEAEQRGVDPATLIDERLELARDDESGVAPIAEYAEEIVRGVALEMDGIDSTIASYLAPEWPLRRLPAVDRAILRVGTWELFHNPDVPPRVAVVEGVELASEYSTDVAPPYINAVLDAEADIANQARMAAAAVRVTSAPADAAPIVPGTPTMPDPGVEVVEAGSSSSKPSDTDSGGETAETQPN
ncbi:transcription antitermination factor NusB [Corynebacterium freneyi]|nr:transcription antitermination factor NusB [Corynebacterium freneyi]MDK8766976.1 transcription antitermination factor NusB [Corynebacterium freneyi]